MTDTDPGIDAHLERQADTPEGFVRLDDGRTRPVGGTNDNESPGKGTPGYLPDPPWAKL
jgi:hypothetical protein